MSRNFALLGLLAESPKYGYEIKRQSEGALGNVWSVSYGQLYPTLRWLSELGWVTKKTEPGKKAAEKNIYSITEKGRKKLDEWLLKPVRSTYRLKDEFTLRFLFFNKLSSARVLDYLGQHRKRPLLQRETFQGNAGVTPGGNGLLPAGNHAEGHRPPGGGKELAGRDDGGDPQEAGGG